jgi:MFS transporter, DHA1 family, tetracycline resistance protein
MDANGLEQMQVETESRIDLHGGLNDDSAPEDRSLTFWERLKRLRVILLLMFLTGFVTSTPSSTIPMLQEEAFGNNSFAITGGFSAGKGILGCIIIPFYGSFSDRTGRKTVLLITEAATVIPYAMYLATGDFWVYSATDLVFGFYYGTMTLLLTSVADLVPVATGSHADSFALAVASFFLGISVAPFIGAYLEVEIVFLVCAGVSVLTLVATFLLYEDRRAALSAPLLGAPQHQQHTEGDQPLALSEQTSHGRRLMEAWLNSADLRWITVIVFANGLAENLLDSLLMLYLRKTLHFTSEDRSVVIAILGVGSVIGLIAVTRLMRMKLGSLGTLRLDLLVNVLTCSLYSFVTAKWGIYAVTSLSVAGMGVFPCACAVAALCLEHEAAGLAQGVATAARMLSGGIAPIAFGLVFNATAHSSFPGVTFLIAAMCVLAAFVTTRFLTPRLSSKKL